MTLWQALGYFVREAAVNLGRSWKVSAVAVATIAVSLFVGGVFLVVSGNLARVVEEARQDLRVVVYFAPEATREQVEAVAAAARRAAAQRPWVGAVERVTSEEARERFVGIFPALAELVERDPRGLPASVEIGVEPGEAPEDDYRRWLDELRAGPGVSMVDDDREWIGRLGAVVAVVRGLGLALGGVLLGAAVFTIGSVIRLTAYLYEEEIAIMRLVGATEFFIRGPFYAGGLLQGTFGGLVAAGVLWVAFRTVAVRMEGSLIEALALARAPGWGELALLVALGAGAGLLGAVISLRGESLGEPPVDEA